MDGDLASEPDDDRLAPELASARQACVLRSAFNVGDDYGSSTSHLLPPPASSSRTVKMSAPAILEPKTCVLLRTPPAPVFLANADGAKLRLRYILLFKSGPCVCAQGDGLPHEPAPGGEQGPEPHKGRALLRRARQHHLRCARP